MGEHLVGYVTLTLGVTGQHPDAPAWLQLRFAERRCELDEKAEHYHGWISPAWIQQEQLHVDVLPTTIRLPRRYAFRYLQIEALAGSDHWKVTVERIDCETVSSADWTVLPAYKTEDAELQRLDKIACKTLHDCMQQVFEDGPKRDRRLWLGDLRLQALANYETFRQYDLVKRCLYLFAGSTLSDGQIGAGMFTAPRVQVDMAPMFDYSLLFVPTLLDYFNATKDTGTLRELWPTALEQIRLASRRFDEQNIVRDGMVLGWCFIDWNLQLNRQASAQGVYLYCVRAAEHLAAYLNDRQTEAWLCEEYAQKRSAAEKVLYAPSQGLFVSGKERQVSWASQIWMVLGGAADAQVLDAVAKWDNAIGITTPYLYHHYVQALLDTGRRAQALNAIREYWGSMAKSCADTFWELYRPDAPDASPYGGTLVNSYCHAWSCGPAYFLRRYFSRGKP
ncbi:hypothetical protein NE475_14185 [Ruthenibacterium lactatiformans]|nr:hypothetical protein [Ruthenibacterium lactatiformans]MCQ5089399.1 hypothetical protein [Ruthenibacterium lactatiformans]